MHGSNYSVESVFLGLHLLHRVYYPLLEKYEGNDIAYYSERIVKAIIVLAGSIASDTGIISWLGYNRSMRKEVYEMMTDILKISEGIISSLTYWDYASSKEDLFPLIQDIISCNYNPNLIRETTTGTNKCVGIREVMSYQQMVQFDKSKTTEQMREPITVATFPIKVRPCSLKIKGSRKKLEGWWKHRKVNLAGRDLEDIQIYYSVTLHNRDKLPNLALNIALNIYRAFYERAEPLDDFVLDTIYKVDWRLLKHSIITNIIFPF